MIYDVSIVPLPMQAVVDLKGDATGITSRLQRLGLSEPEPGHATTFGPVQVVRVGREHWLLRGPLEDEQRLLSTLQEGASPVDTLVLAVSDAYAFFGVAGPHARQIMAIASPLDTDTRAFPADGATFTEAFGQKALVLRNGSGFELAFERSYACMASDYFSRINGGPDGPAGGGNH